MARYRRDYDRESHRLPIFLTVALGIGWAGAVGFVERLMAVGYWFEAIHTSFTPRQEKIDAQAESSRLLPDRNDNG